MRHVLLAAALTGSLASCSLIGALTSGLDDPRYRVATYNIRHGRGMDDQVALERTASTLRRLDVDIVALQEVDENVARSGRGNQAEVLGNLLDMDHAFGAFMAYGGGRYGIAILSRHPIVHVESVALPAGAEPRVALAATIVLPGDDTVTVVSVHFDWIDNDAARYNQARALTRYLDGVSRPWLLMGDFNDGPASRTLRLFSGRVLDFAKPADASFTFPAPDPVKEIDYILASEDGGWAFESLEVVPDALASDHRPVVAVLKREPTVVPVAGPQSRPRPRQP